MIKKLLLALLFLSSATTALADSHPWVKSDIYKMTQSTYVNDIDAINIAFASMDKACWKNLPYGAPYIENEHSLTVNRCGVLSEGKVQRLHGKKGKLLQTFVSYGADYSPDGKVSPIAPLENSIKIGGSYHATKIAFMKLTASISKQFAANQKKLNVSPIEARFIPPQVVDLLIFTNSKNKLHTIYLVSLDGISRQQRFFEIDSEGHTQELSEKTFIRKTSLIVNPLFKR